MEITIMDGKPIYVQIIDGVKKAIARGDVVAGERIASQRDMALQLRVNPNTVQRAYRDMEGMGLVRTIRGEGTYVSDDPGLVDMVRDEMAIGAMLSFFEEMVSLGFRREEIGRMIDKALEDYPKG